MNFSLGHPNSVLLQDHMCVYTIQKPDDNLTLLERYHNELKEFDGCTLMLSGGSDSQFMLRLLQHFNIQFTAITYKTTWKGGVVNTDDVIYAQQVAKQFNVDLEVIDFDLKAFYDGNHHMKWGRELGVSSPQVAMHVEFIDKHIPNNSKLIMGGDMPYLLYGEGGTAGYLTSAFVGLDYLYMDTPAALIGSIKPYHDICENKGIQLIKNISYCSPQALYQILEQQIKIVKEQKIHLIYSTDEPQFREMLEFKKAVWNSIVPGDVDTLMKVGGFERLKKLLAVKSGIYNQYDKLYREPMQTYKSKTDNFRFKHKFDDATKQLPKQFEKAIKESDSKCVNGFHFDF
jgi:hypothetical protein